MEERSVVVGGVSLLGAVCVSRNSLLDTPLITWYTCPSKSVQYSTGTRQVVSHQARIASSITMAAEEDEAEIDPLSDPEERRVLFAALDSFR